MLGIARKLVDHAARKMSRLVPTPCEMGLKFLRSVPFPSYIIKLGSVSTDNENSERPYERFGRHLFAFLAIKFIIDIIVVILVQLFVLR